MLKTQSQQIVFTTTHNLNETVDPASKLFSTAIKNFTAFRVGLEVQLEIDKLSTGKATALVHIASLQQ